MEWPVVRHLLLSLEARYDFRAPLTPYSLGHLAFALGPPPGFGYPFVLSECWLFARIEGADDHELWAELIRLAEPDDEVLAAYGPFVIPFGPDARALSRAWCLRGVAFPNSGWYEFRLICGGEILATEPVFLEEQ